jgi:hypothetical protein
MSGIEIDLKGAEIAYAIRRRVEATRKILVCNFYDVDKNIFEKKLNQWLCDRQSLPYGFQLIDIKYTASDMREYAMVIYSETAYPIRKNMECDECARQE